MKSLALLRHAKSSWDEPRLADFDRPLNGRGRKAAKRIGAEMRRMDLAFDLTIASPAVRARETLDLVQEGYGTPLETRFEARVYEASAETLFEIIRGVSDNVDRLLMVGHNPGFQQLAGAITRSDDPSRSRVVTHYPTAALLVTELPANAWREVERGSGRIVEFVIPRALTDG